MSKKLTRYIALYGIGVYLLALLVISVAFRACLATEMDVVGHR